MQSAQTSESSSSLQQDWCSATRDALARAAAGAMHHSSSSSSFDSTREAIISSCYCSGSHCYSSGSAVCCRRGTRAAAEKTPPTDVDTSQAATCTRSRRREAAQAIRSRARRLERQV